jgi:hypothetical protein
MSYSGWLPSKQDGPESPSAAPASKLVLSGGVTTGAGARVPALAHIQALGPPVSADRDRSHGRPIYPFGARRTTAGHRGDERLLDLASSQARR